MKQNKLTFESENLVVDYISFNIPGYIQSAYIQKIASYLFESFGFNSTFTKDHPTQGWKEETIFYNDENPYKVFFRQFDYNPKIKSFWIGTKIIFSGENAEHFYNQIKKKPI